MYRNSFTGGRGRRRRSSFARRIGRILSDARKWLYRNSRLAILIGGGVVLLTAIVLIVTLVIVPAVQNKTPEGNASLDAEGLEGEDLAEAEQYQQQLESGEIDDETLAGLTGEGLTDSDLVLETEEQPVMVGMICGSGSNAVAEGFGRRAEKLIDEGAGIEAYLVYKVEDGSTYNAQVQDVRSLINRGCAVIVVADVSPLTYDMIVTLASKNDVSVVAVDAPEETGYAVNIKSAGSNVPQELAGFIAANASPGTVETVASSQSFAKSMTGAYSAAFSGKGFTAAAPIAWGAEGYRESFAGRIAERPAALAVEGKIAVAVLEEGAKNGYIGEVFATEANAGIIKKWYSMRNGGLSVTATVKNEDGTETESTIVSGFNSSCKLIASVGYDKASLGSTACEFAAKLAAGYTLKKEGSVYELPASQPVTDSNLQSYYDKYKDAADDTPVSAQIENTDISAMFNAPVNTEY